MVYSELLEKMKGQKLHMTLIDPDKQSPGVAGDMASTAESLGSDAIMIGGSTGVTQEILDATVLEIKENTSIPVILFPTAASAISAHADAIYFMSLLNSRNPKYLIREQMKAAPYLKSTGLDIISMGYILVEPGMKVGEVGEAEVVPRENPDVAVGYAMAAEMLGMRLIYLEAGSGAPQPVPPRMVSAVKKKIDVPLIVGGGIRSAEAASAAVLAGADVIVTGTLVEQDGWKEKLSDLISAIK